MSSKYLLKRVAITTLLFLNERTLEQDSADKRKSQRFRSEALGN